MLLYVHFNEVIGVVDILNVSILNIIIFRPYVRASIYVGHCPVSGIILYYH